MQSTAEAYCSAWGPQKLQEYLSGRSILTKLQAKHEKLQEAIERGVPAVPPPLPIPMGFATGQQQSGLRPP